MAYTFFADDSTSISDWSGFTTGGWTKTATTWGLPLIETRAGTDEENSLVFRDYRSRWSSSTNLEEETEENPSERKAFFEKLFKSLEKAKDKKITKILEREFQKVTKYRELGLEKIANELAKEATRIMRYEAIAKYKYKKITWEKVEKFRRSLGFNKVLEIIPLKELNVIPPKKVLAKLETAIKRKIFDDFLVFSIRRVPDPILFGVIKEDLIPSETVRPEECYRNYFFIAQWDKDIKLADIIGK